MSYLRFLSIGIASTVIVGCSGQQYITLEPAQLEISTDLLEFGEQEQGDLIEKTVTLSNSGDVSLGIESIELASALDPKRGQVGGYRVVWNCEDVKAADVESEGEESNRTPSPDTASETGEDPPETGDIETGETGSGPNPSGEFACVIPAGGVLPVRVKFAAEVAGENWDALVVTTKGEVQEKTDAGTPIFKAPDETVHRDLDNLWKMVYLHGVGLSNQPNALIQPKTVDFGFVYQTQEQMKYLTIRNVGDGELKVEEVKIDESNCGDGFEIISKPEAGALISGRMSKVVELKYTPVTDREVQCYLEVTTNDPDATTERVLMKSNSGTNALNVAPSAVIHSPQNGYQHRGSAPLEMEVTVFDANEPASNLYCSVRSALQGEEYGKPGVATCRPEEGNESGHLTVQIPHGDGEFIQSGLDVLILRVTDDSGVTREASISVLFNADFPDSDDDGDGFGTSDPLHPDCDDSNISSYPFAAELADGADNDCDRIVDEGTDASDDDGDGMSEDAGDCNDASVTTYMGAPEIPDGGDNDCDGVVDDNTTAYDDDGDGFAEIDLDCDDSDPTVNPGAVEICDDGIDNNCNAQKDVADQSGCVAKDSTPMIVGRINLTRTSIEEGGTTQASVKVYEADGDSVNHEWQVSDGEGVIDDPTSPTITWTGPDKLPKEYADGNVYRFYYVASDDDENQEWAFEEVWMYKRGKLDIELRKAVQSSCSSTGLEPISLGLTLGLLAVGLRRRR